MIVSAISISQLVLNEIAWSPGDPGTGAPSFLGSAPPHFLAAPISRAGAVPIALCSHPLHMEVPLAADATRARIRG
jgi:hypothetical protein